MVKLKTKNMKKITYISIILILFSSCRIVKKSYLEENYKSNEQIEQFAQELTTKIENKTKKVTEEKLKQFSSTINKASEKTRAETSKNSEAKTDLKATIKAEEGKTKSFTANGLEVVSNGADITITSSNKSSQSEKIIKEQKKEIEELKIYKLQSSIKISELEKNQIEQKENFQKEISELKQKLESKSKKVTLLDLPFSFWLIFIGFGVVVLVLGKIKNPFTRK